MYKTIGLLIIALFIVTSVTAQNEATRTFMSEDGAVQFNYPDGWTIVQQNTTFNAAYRYEFWTSSSSLALYLGTDGRIFMEILNPGELDYPNNLVTPLDFAKYTLRSDKLDASETEIAGYPAVRVLQHGDVSDRLGRFYAIVRDDDWVVLISVGTSAANIDDGESALLEIAESLVFDANAAATPFVRNLEQYDISRIELAEIFTSNDGNVTLQYPSDWEMSSFVFPQPPEAAIGYFLNFTVPESIADITITVMDVTNDFYNYPLDQNSPQEYMREQRRLATENGAQFRIGDSDATSVLLTDEEGVQQTIAFALNDEWVTTAEISATDAATAASYEPTTVAVLDSLKLTLGTPYITSPVLTARLPESWQLGKTEQAEGEFYVFTLRPVGPIDPMGPRILIQLIHLGPERAAEIPSGIAGLKAIVDQAISQAATIQSQPERLKIDEYRILRVHVYVENQKAYGAYTLFWVDQNWLMLIWTGSSAQEDVTRMVRDSETIIEDMTLMLSED